MSKTLPSDKKANAAYIDYVTNGAKKTADYACSKCLLLPNETIFRKSIQPQQQKLLGLKCKRKNNLTLQNSKKMLRYKQQLIVKCSTCSNIVKLPLLKPQKDQRMVSITQIPVKKKKRKKSSRFAGIDQNAVAQAQQIFRTPATSKDFISLQPTSAPKNQLLKRKIDEVIVLEDSPFLATKKTKTLQSKQEVITVQDSPTPGAKKMTNQIEQVMQGFRPGEIIQIQDSPTPKKAKTHLQQMIEISRPSKPSKKEIQAMKQQAKDVEEARKALEPLASKKEKKKLKHKLKKITDTIKNLEHQNEKRSTLQNFLTSMFA